MNSLIEVPSIFFTKKQNEVIDLYYNKGLSTYKIAEKLNISSRSINYRLKHAIRSLYSCSFGVYSESLIQEIRKIVSRKNHKKGNANYNVYASQLEWCENEEVRRNPKYRADLQVRCTYCRKWFDPTQKQVESRVGSLKGWVTGANRFYCSEKCKNNCCLYNQQKYRRGENPNKSQREQLSYLSCKLREEVLKRDNYKCQHENCQETTIENLECHHILCWSLYEEYRLNPDNCITLCKFHHQKASSIIKKLTKNYTIKPDSCKYPYACFLIESK